MIGAAIIAAVIAALALMTYLFATAPISEPDDGFDNPDREGW